MNSGDAGLVPWPESSGCLGLGPPDHTGVVDPEISPGLSGVDSLVLLWRVLWRRTWLLMFCCLDIARCGDWW